MELGCLICERLLATPYPLLWLCDRCAYGQDFPIDKYVYIITDEHRQKQGIYKIGKHTGNLGKLLSRYGTYLVDPIVLVFQPTGSYTDLMEDLLKDNTMEFVVRKKSGRTTEWRCMSLDLLIKMFITSLTFLGKRRVAL
jgi:hypothetical protein